MLRPLGGAQQRRLLRVPSGVHDRAVRAPSVFHEPSHGLGLGHERHHPAGGVRGAHRPAVAVVAPDHPFVRVPSAPHLGDDVVGRRQLPVEGDPQPHRGRPRSDVVGQRQRPPPGRRRNRAFQRFQKRLGVAPRDRQHRDLHDRGRFLPVQPLGVGRGAGPRGQRIARVLGHVQHRAQLHAVLLPEGALRVGVALVVAVVARVRVEDRAHGPLLVGDLRLDPAPRSPVAGDHDLAADIDPPAFQILVVRRDAVVHVDQLGGHVSVGRVGVVRGKAVLLDLRGTVLRQHRLAKPGRVALGRQQLQLPHPRHGEQHVVALQLGLEAPRAELLDHPVRRLLVVGRSHVDRRGNDVLHPVPQVVGVQSCVVASFEFALGGRALGREAIQAAVLRLAGHGGGIAGNDGGQGDGTGGGAGERASKGGRATGGQRSHGKASSRSGR